MRPPKILVETKVVEDGVVWKIKGALYGLRTSPIAWETERDNTLKSLTWSHEETEYKLLPCPGSPCLWTVIPLRTGEDPSVKASSEELTRGVVITYVDDLLFTGWQHHINSITKALLAKYVMKKSGVLPVGKPDAENPSNGIDFLGAQITRSAFRRPDFGPIRGDFQRRFSPKRSPPPPNPDEVGYVILDIAFLRVTATFPLQIRY